MQKYIVGQSRWKQDALVNLGLPPLTGVEVNYPRVRLYAAYDGHTRRRRPLKGHGRARRRKVANDKELDLIAPLLQMRRNIERVIVPDEGTAPRRPDGNALPVDVELVPSVCREMKQGLAWARGEVKLAGEGDDSASGVFQRGIDPARHPDPIGLELVYRLARSDNAQSIRKRRG